MTDLPARFARIARLLRTCPDCGQEKPAEEDVCRFCHAVEERA